MINRHSAPELAAVIEEDVSMAYANPAFEASPEVGIERTLSVPTCATPRMSPRPSPLRRFKSNMEFVMDMGSSLVPESPSVKKKANGGESGGEQGLRTLHQAARDGDVRVMRYLLDGIGGNFIRRKINQLDEDELSPLHYAARYNFCDMVKLLVDRGANVNIRGEDGLTPLHFAARYKKIKTPKRSEESSDESFKNGYQFISDNNSPQESTRVNTRFRSLTSQHPFQKKPFLNKSLRSDSHDSNDSCFSRDLIDSSGCNSVILFLAINGAHVNAKDNFGLTPLHYAAMRGNEVAARELLLCKGINIEARDNQEMTPLHLVAIHGSVEIASLLMEADADIRCRDKNHATPLHKAAMEGHLDILCLLLETADTKGDWIAVSQLISDQDNDLDTALHLAVDNGHREIVRVLIEKGADVNTPRHNFIFPLHLAAVSGDVEIVKLLLAENNARIDCLNRVQETPLYRAAEYNQAAVMEYLILNGAAIDRRDKDNFTPLLIAACEGHVEAIKCLIKHGADISAVDKNDKTAIYWAAEENHIDALVVLLQDSASKELIDRGDRYGNSPLHVAAMKGYLGIVQYLLDQGAQIDHKNEDEQTPLHFAAKFGRTKVVRELVRRDKPIVNDEDEDSNTPLHLAALAGHDRAVQVLLDAGADNEARNSHQWTALDCAAAKGWIKTATVLLEADCPIDPPDKIATTPLHLAASKGHTEVVQLLLQWGAKVSRLDDQGRNCLELAVENSHKNVAMAIIQSDHWSEALRNETINTKTKMRDTPMRMLIRKLPDVAEKVFYRCTTTNRVPSEHVSFAVTFNYEFLDDMYATFQDSNTITDTTTEVLSGSKGNIYDEDNKLKSHATLYSRDVDVLKSNHPLMIMVSSRRRKLLSHPLCMSLVHLKWLHFGRYIYYANLLFYILFVTFLTGYILSLPAPTLEAKIRRYPSPSYTTSSSPSSFVSNETSESGATTGEPYLESDPDDVCSRADDSSHPQGPALFAIIGKYVIMVLSILNFIRECFQIYQVRVTYISFENLLEWTCYITSLLLVMDFTECSAITGVRQSWQWQMGSITIFLAWVNLMLFIRKFPFLGIYVVMFTYVFSTFVKAFSVLSLMIIAFGLGFYTIMHNQEVFETPWKSIVRVITMMLGEFQFDDIFDNDDLAYPIPSYILFTIFMMLTNMIMLNLLVGLAVDDIKEVQEQAELRRLAMQVELVLNVESVLPKFLHRRFIMKQHSVLPNQRQETFFRKILDKIEHFEMTNIAMIYSGKNEKTDLERIQDNQEALVDNLASVQQTVRQVEIQNQRLESLLMTLVSHKGLQWEDEDEYSINSAL